MRALLIYNPTAGQRDQGVTVAEVASHLRSYQWDVRVRETSRGGDARRFAREAVAEGLDAVIIAGGDGTINEAANGLAFSPVALGVLPAGTANVWAQEIGLPIPRVVTFDANVLLTCARLLAEGTVRKMDLGKAGERYFVLYGSVGFDAYVARQMEGQQELKRSLGGTAYLLAGLRAALRYIGTRAIVDVDGKQFRRRIWAVMAANTQLYGGVIRVAPDARADDGWLDLVVIRGHGLYATLRHFISFAARGLWADPQVEYFRARAVEVRTRRPMPIQVDGEPIGLTPTKFTIAPLALKVLVPKDAGGQVFGRDRS